MANTHRQILCRSEGAGRQFRRGDYKDFAPPERAFGTRNVQSAYPSNPL
jgi:hypothetical protein